MCLNQPLPVKSTLMFVFRDSPIGDDSSSDLVRNITRTSERLSRRGSKSSNASSLSRQSFHGCRSRGSSFQERGKVSALMGNSMKKSQSGDFHNQMEATPTATNMDVVAADVTKDDVRRTGDVSGESQEGGAPPSHSTSTQLKHASNQPGTAADCVHPLNLSSCSHTPATTTYLSNSTQIDSIIKDIKAINLAMEVNEQATSASASEIVDETRSDIESTLQDCPDRVSALPKDCPDRMSALPADCESPVVISGQRNGENCQVVMTCSPTTESVGEVNVTSLTADTQTDWTVDILTAKTGDYEIFQTVGGDSKPVIDIVKREATEESIQQSSSQASPDMTLHNVCCDERQAASALDDDVRVFTPSNITTHATFCENWQPSEKQQLLIEADASTVPGRILTLTEVQQDITSASNYNQVINNCLENEQNCETTGVTSITTACVQRRTGQTNGQCYISSLTRDKASVNLESYQIDPTSGNSQKSTSQITTDNSQFEPSSFPVVAMFASGGTDLSQDASNQTVIFI